jgi:hypothetical protein
VLPAPSVDGSAFVLAPRSLEDENAKLKKLLAETMLDNAILKDINSRKW